MFHKGKFGCRKLLATEFQKFLQNVPKCFKMEVSESTYKNCDLLTDFPDKSQIFLNSSEGLLTLKTLN